MNDIFDLFPPIEDMFMQEVTALFLYLEQGDPGTYYQFIKNFITTFDDHSGLIACPVYKKDGTLSKRVKHRAWAEYYDGIDIDDYLPALNKKFHKGDCKEKLRRALIVKAYIMQKLNFFNHHDFIIEAFKLYNRIDHRYGNITAEEFKNFIIEAYNNHNEIPEKIYFSSYQKKEKYQWKLEDFHIMADASLEDNYKWFVSIYWPSFSKSHKDVKLPSYMTFRRILQKIGYKKKYAERKKQ